MSAEHPAGNLLLKQPSDIMQKAESVLGTPPLNTSAINPTAGLDWLDIKDDASPADIFRAIGRLRKEARNEIDRLIRFLDESENHMCVDDEDGHDAEPDTHDEPSLGFLEIPNQERITQGPTDRWFIDREIDTSDDEPSLGFLEYHPTSYGYGRDHVGHQLMICQGKGGDLEAEHDGAEPPVDEEPSLGWTVDGCMVGALDDREFS